MTMPTPPQYKDIMSMNSGEKTLPSTSEILDIDMRPNRCGISS